MAFVKTTPRYKCLNLNGQRFQKLLHCQCFLRCLQGHKKFLAKCHQVLNHRASIIETKALFTREKSLDSTIVGEFRFLLSRFQNSSVYAKGAPCSQPSQPVYTEGYRDIRLISTGFRFVPHQWLLPSQRMARGIAPSCTTTRLD